MKKMMTTLTAIGLASLVGYAGQNNLEGLIRKNQDRQTENSATQIGQSFQHDSPKNLADAFLTMESYNGATESDHKILNDIISTAEGKIERKANYTHEEAEKLLSVIDTTIREKGFSYKEQRFLNKGLKEREIDCDLFSDIYFGIADDLNLPVRAVMIEGKEDSGGGHVFVRWRLDSQNYFNWEATSGQVCSDEVYDKRISENSTKYGSMKELSIPQYAKLQTDEQIFPGSFLKDSNARAGIAHPDNKECREHENLIYRVLYDYLSNRLRSNPDSRELHELEAETAMRLERYDQAIANYDFLLKESPQSSSLYHERGKAYELISHTAPTFKEELNFMERAKKDIDKAVSLERKE